MDCKIIYTGDKRTGVIGLDGKPSETFQEILNNGQVKDFDEALQIYKGLYSDKIELPQERVADKLPLTLALFNTQSFQDLQGKQVNPVTVQQLLNKTGIKQIEKDLVNQVIEDNYKGQKRISYDELEALVRASVMPLERITTSSYADYGMDNLGNGDYGEAKTLILNAPIEHGVTGHFSGDFKASGRQNIKYVPKQLNDNTWVAVEEGYEAGANENNIYQYVGTAGTKEAVNAWIENYNILNESAQAKYTVYEDQYYKTGDFSSPSKVLKGFNTYQEAEQWIKDNQDNFEGTLDYLESSEIENKINKGMFGHIRVWENKERDFNLRDESNKFDNEMYQKYGGEWQDKLNVEEKTKALNFIKRKRSENQVFYVAELQSDIYQKNNAKNLIEPFTPEYTVEKVKLQKKYQDLTKVYFEKIGITVLVDNPFLLNLSTPLQINRAVDNKTILLDKDSEIQKLLNAIDEGFKSDNVEVRRQIDKDISRVIEIVKVNTNIEFNKDYNKELNELKNKYLSPQEKQFIASQKIWEQRMVREAIKEASLSGATSLRFPTPYTLSVIEGYVTNEKREQATPYNFNGSADTILRVGETVTDANEYNDLVVVNSTQSNITVKNLNDGISGGKEAIYDKVLDQLIRAEVFTSADSESKYEEFQKDNEVFKTIPYSVISSEDVDFVEKVVYRSIEDANIDIKALFGIKEDNTLIRQTFKKFVNQIGMYDSAKNRLLVWEVGARETTFGQPYTYKESSKSNFNILDLSETQQTVARKYEEIAEILKKEKPVEVVTDENGFDWYEAPITQEDTQSPVVAFSLKTLEPSLQYQNKQGQIFNSYSEALKATDGGKISIGVNTLKGFKELANIDVNTNTNTIEGTINALVKANLLTGVKTEENTFETVGNDSARKLMSAEVIKEEVRKIHGVRSAFTTADGNIKIQKTAQEITKKDGSKISIEELDQLSYSELKANFDDYIAILAVRDAKNAIENKEEREETQFTPENVLQEKLMSLLKKFGIQTMDLQDYVDKFKLKNGVEPSASALADIAHKIVAFRDGIITTEDLSEEVAHFIVASTSVAEKENMLRNVHRTQEWMEFSEAYREIYGKTMSGEQLENAVREEILGKVLANGLISRFQAGENTTQTQQSILNKLADILQQFFNKIAGYIQDRYKTELAQYSEDIYNNLMLETLELDTKAFDNYKFNMYSAPGARSSKAKTILDATSEILTLLKNQEFKLYKGSQPNRAKLQELQDAIDNADKINSAANAIVIAQKQIDYLTRAVNKERSGFPLTQEELSVYETFKNQTSTLLSQISDLVGGNTKEERKLQEEIKKALGDFATIEGKIQNKEGVVIDLLIKRVIEKHKLSGKEAQKYREVITTFKGDTNAFHAHLGTLTNARNPLLNIASDIINKVYIQGRDYSLSDIKSLAQILEDNGLSPKDAQKLFKDGYLIDNVDYAKYDETVNQIKLEAYNRIAKKTLEVKDFIKLEKEGIEWENPEQRKEYSKEISDKTKGYRVNFFTDDFLDKQEKDYKDVPEEALDYHRRDRAERGDIRSGATLEDGVTVIYDNNDTFRLRELNTDRAKKASAYSEGVLKEGLIPNWNSETRKMEYTLADNASSEAKIAYGLQIIAKVQKDSFPAGEEKAIPQKFYDYLNQLVSDKEKLDFIYNNAYVGFTDEFWSSFGSDETLLEKLRNAGEEDLVEEITKQQQIKAEILKANRKYNSPSETLVGTTMSKAERDAIKLAEEDLEVLYAEARKILGEEQSEEEQEKAYTQATNEAYKQDLEDEESDELEFIKKHTTSRSRIAIDRFARAARDKTAEIKGNYRNFLSEEMNDVQREEAIVNFAKSRLLPYYKRTEPIGFTELMNSENIVYNILNSPLLQVSPNFSFYESQVNDNVNPKFLENKAQGKPQIKEELFSNKAFKDTFGKVVNGKPEKNQALWNVREEFLKVQKNTLENMGMLGKANLFQIPQVGKRGLRQFVDVIEKKNKGVIKEMVKDFLEYREDEQEFGAGNGVVPRYYLNKLENQEDVSDDYLYSYALMSQQAGLYRARVENIGDMLSVKQALLKQDFKGKSAEASNAYKMFKSYLDNNFYGVQETFQLQWDVFGQKIDLGALAKRFYKWVQKVNLAGLVVPVTSLLQGSVTKRIETTIGETINSTASSLANKEMVKLAPGASAEMLKFNSKSRINILLEGIGTYDNVQNRFENSIYNKFTRGITKIASFTHDLANFPIVPRVALSVMMDYRYVDGQILNRNQFLRQADRDGKLKNKKEDWTKYELFYSDIKTDTGVITFDKTSMAKKLGLADETILDTIIAQTKEAITNRTLVAIQRIDTQISEQDKSLAARHSIAQFFLQHSSWMILGTMQKFKSRHLNLNSGEWEEGNWITAYNTLKNLVKKTDGLSYVEHVKKVWEDSRGDEMQRRNINRVGIEVAMVTTLAVLSQIVSGFLDDEEDPSYALQVSDYFLYRTTNEVISSTVALPKAYVDKVKSPLSSLDRILDLTDILDLASGQEVTRGKYAGMTERQRWLVRNVPLIKDGSKLYNIEKETETYKFYNKDNEKWNILYYNLLKNAE